MWMAPDELSVQGANDGPVRREQTALASGVLGEGPQGALNSPHNCHLPQLPQVW